MTRTVLLGVAGYFLALAIFMWAEPLLWYNTVPGVAATGGYNAHFIRDLALTFAVSGLALIAGVRWADQRLVLFGAAWPCLHALFHIWIWVVHRQAALDLVALSNLLGIQLPAWGALACAVYVEGWEVRA